MNKRYLVALLAVLLGLDLVFTLVQNLQLPLDGDLAPIVVPSPWYYRVLHDPFGWAVLTENAVYAAPNRFFAHLAMVGYLRHVPLWLQGVVTPINSVYLAGALFNTAVHALLLGLLATYIRLVLPGARSWHWWLGAALLAPLFQTAGFNGQMGIILPSLTYNFFYGLPLALLLLWLLPFCQAACRVQAFHLPGPLVLVWLGLTVVLALNGTVVTAAVAVLLLGIGAHGAWQQRHLLGGDPAARSGLVLPAWWSWQGGGLLLALGLLCLYSLYIGRNNAENSNAYSLGELYQLLPRGVFQMLSSKLGLPLLVLFVLINAQLLRRLPASPASEKVRQVLRWVGLFAVVYILLLPLGGYRPYRAYLLRNDSVMPVLLGLLFAYGLSTGYVLQLLSGRARRWYLGGVLLLSLIFINADGRLWLRENNSCERQALAQLATAPGEVVRLPATCRVLSWELVTNPEQTAAQADLLYYWGVTPKRRLYYQESPAQPSLPTP